MASFISDLQGTLQRPELIAIYFVVLKILSIIKEHESLISSFGQLHLKLYGVSKRYQWGDEEFAQRQLSDGIFNLFSFIIVYL